MFMRKFLSMEEWNPLPLDLHKVPLFASRLAERIQTARKDAIPAQKNGMWLHACALFDAAAT